jgi:uncharacterized protein (TIGR03437 family)
MNGRKKFASLLILSAAGCSICLAQTTTATYTYSGASLPIFYETGSSATFVNLNVPGALQISTVTATVSVSYPTTGDLNVYLFGPDGTRTILTEKNCGSQSTLVNITFADSAQSMYSSFCPAQSGGTYRGNQPLSNYQNKGSAGTWTLAVQNNTTPGTVGTVTAFSLTITGTALTPPTITGLANAVSLATGAIAPGELIGISGANIGPTPGAIASASSLPLTLGNTQITINDQPIPLYYVSSTLAAGVVPYQAIPGNPAVIGGQVTVKVIYNGVTSNSFVTNLTSSSPALFSITNTSTNAQSVKATNQDGTLNSSTNPAAVGSYVSLYASGLGAVQPSGFQAGQAAPTTPLYTTVGPTFVAITGQSATVSFSGLAPGSTSVYQVNALIPAGTPSGAQPIVLSNMVGASQANLKIYIK